jgi:hypothetical protein
MRTFIILVLGVAGCGGAPFSAEYLFQEPDGGYRVAFDSGGGAEEGGITVVPPPSEDSGMKITPIDAGSPPDNSSPVIVDAGRDSDVPIQSVDAAIPVTSLCCVVYGCQNGGTIGCESAQAFTCTNGDSCQSGTCGVGNQCFVNGCVGGIAECE